MVQSLDLFALTQRPQTKEEAHALAISMGARCHECPLYGLRQGPVYTERSTHPRLLIIGEAPGKQEVQTKRPFVGASGLVLDNALEAGGLQRHDCTITNATLCKHENEKISFDDYLETLNRDHRKAVARAEREGLPLPPPPVSPFEACRPRLEKEIADTQTKTVLAVGGKALKALAQHYGVPYGTGQDTVGEVSLATILNQHGSPVQMPNGQILCSSLHPAFAMRKNRQFTNVVFDHIKRAAEIVARGDVVDWRPPDEAYIFVPKPGEPAVDQNWAHQKILELCARLVAAKDQALVTVDIETDTADAQHCHVRLVGLGHTLNGRELAFGVPFRWRDGRRYWIDTKKEVDVRRAVKEVLDNCTLVAHHGAFDTRVLIDRERLMADDRRTWMDCYLESETEFLTDKGWLRYDDVGEARLATINQITHEQEFQRPTATVDKSFSGDIYTIESLHTRAVVTGNHRMWHQPARRRKGGAADHDSRKSWQFLPLTDMLQGPDRAYVLRAPNGFRARHTGQRIAKYKQSAEFARLLGLFIADGNFLWRGDRLRGFAITQKLDGRAYKTLQKLRTSFDLQEYGPYRRSDAWRTRPCLETRWVSEDLHLTRHLLPVGRYSKDRRLPSWWNECPEFFRFELLQGLLDGDGSSRGDRELYRTASKALAGDVQALALSLSMPAFISRERGIYVVCIDPDGAIEERIAPRLSNSVSNANVQKRRVKNARIVCFTVPNETLVTRSRGKAAFYGNTQNGHHDTAGNDLPHDLGFVVRQYLEAPLWKKDVDHKAAVGVATDYDLHAYNVYGDIIGTMRLWPKIREDIIACGNIEQFRLDTKVAVVARDMSRNGLWIDEAVRGDLSLKLNKLCDELRTKFTTLTGVKNAGSWQQISRWLYEDLGLVRHDSEGKEIGEDEEDTKKSSTSSAALFQILDLGVSPEVEDAIDCLLEFRACDKLRGTYVDNLKVSYVDEPSPWPRPGWSAGTSAPAAGTLLGLGLYDELPAVVYNGEEILPKRPAVSRLFSNHKIHVVPSGRWTTDPSYHNWPSRGWIVDGAPINTRLMVVAPPGHVLVGADYEQLELRGYGVIANDKYVLKAFRDRLEPHCLNAATILAEREEDIFPLYEQLAKAHALNEAMKRDKRLETPENIAFVKASNIKYIRTVAKRVAYLKNYGGEHDKLFAAMAAERDKATNARVFPKLKKERVDEWERRWDARHPETKIWHARVARDVRTRGFVQTAMLTRRKRFFPGGPNKKNAPPNHEIQGLGAEFANAAALRIAERIPFGSWSPYTGLCLQVHDYLAVYVPEDRAEEAARIIEESMYFEMPCQDGWMMPFPAQAVISKNWAKNA